MSVRVVATTDTLERLSRARDACRELLDAFAADRPYYTMDARQMYEVEE